MKILLSPGDRHTAGFESERRQTMAGQAPVQTPKFPLGSVFITPGAHDRAQFLEEDLGAYIKRHHHGDWGELDPEDRQLNDRAVTNGSRILSSYKLKDGQTKIWIITDAEVMDGVRISTTILLPEEY